MSADEFCLSWQCERRNEMKLNHKNIRKVRDHISGLEPNKFDMMTWGRRHSCDTAACIGGWADRVCGITSVHYTETADVLGISYVDAGKLFYPQDKWEFSECPYRATPAQAARVLDILDKTGEVRWDLAMAEVLEPA
jgi:hypothetical protein